MIYIGTSGYSYKDWIGPFYPEGTKSTAMLEYYALHFKFTEVNSSYYHMPSLRLFESMDRKTPDGFRFAVKLFGGFTHERSADKSDAEKFLYSLKPLMEKGKLICLLAQFPYSFHCNTENAEHLKRIREWFKGVELSVEFRNQEWISSETMKLLKEEELGFVCVDEPGLKGLVSKVVAVTSPVAYLRMHGRNYAKWYSGEGSERYNYLYSREEILEWIPRIQEMESQSKTVVVAFNNHPVGKAVLNAGALSEILNG